MLIKNFTTLNKERIQKKCNYTKGPHFYCIYTSFHSHIVRATNHGQGQASVRVLSIFALLPNPSDSEVMDNYFSSHVDFDYNSKMMSAQSFTIDQTLLTRSRDYHIIRYHIFTYSMPNFLVKN